MINSTRLPTEELRNPRNQVLFMLAQMTSPCTGYHCVTAMHTLLKMLKRIRFRKQHNFDLFPTSGILRYLFTTPQERGVHIQR